MHVNRLLVVAQVLIHIGEPLTFLRRATMIIAVAAIQAVAQPCFEVGSHHFRHLIILPPNTYPRLGLNQRHSACDADALPLSYEGVEVLACKPGSVIEDRHPSVPSTRSFTTPLRARNCLRLLLAAALLLRRSFLV